VAKQNAIPAEKLNDIPIDQLPDIDGDVLERESPIVKAERLPPKQWLDEMAFMDEPVTIRIEPASEKNAAQWFSAMVNGKGAEVRQPDGRWMEMTEGYLPIGVTLTTKRKYLEVILRAKVDVINIANTDTHDVDQGRANVVRRSTTPVHGISIIYDPNPRGPQWAEEVRRRYL
jgi:hypothetical protein